MPHAALVAAIAEELCRRRAVDLSEDEREALCDAIRQDLDWDEYVAPAVDAIEARLYGAPIRESA